MTAEKCECGIKGKERLPPGKEGQFEGWGLGRVSCRERCRGVLVVGRGICMALFLQAMGIWKFREISVLKWQAHIQHWRSPRRCMNSLFALESDSWLPKWLSHYQSQDSVQKSRQ